MSNDLDLQQEISVMAAALGVPTERPAKSILEFCRSKILGWLPHGKMVATISELEKLVCGKLRLVIEEVWSDEALEKLIRKYMSMGELGFGGLAHQLDNTTFGTLYERFRADGRSHDRFIAFIDCRTAAKAARRFFTRWHEIAHALTNYNQLELPLKRSRMCGSPTERMMDAIAAEIGFFDPLFLPLLDTEIQRSGRLTFAGVQRLRAHHSGDASFQATLNASVTRLSFAAAIVEAEVVHKKSELSSLASRQRSLFPAPPPPPKRLRLTSVVPNAAGRKMGLHDLLRVPEDSTLWRAYHEEREVDGAENLSMWEHSGVPLNSMEVSIEARHLEDRVLGLIQSRS
jgi:hypothetical protein